MFSDVHLCEGTHVAHSLHLDREVSQEVYDIHRLVSPRETQDKRRQYRTEEVFY